MKTLIVRLICTITKGKANIASISGEDIPPDVFSSIRIYPPKSLPRNEELEVNVVMVQESDGWRTVPVRYRKRHSKVWRVFK